MKMIVDQSMYDAKVMGELEYVLIKLASNPNSFQFIGIDVVDILILEIV